MTVRPSPAASLRPLATAAALCGLVMAGACGKSFLNLGKVIEAVSPDSVATELFLIGDAGLPAPGGEPVLEALRRQVDSRRAFTVYLGDNVYPTGFPDTAGATRREAERILNAQIAALREAGAKGLLVPGNHDWEAGGRGGLGAINRQEAYLREHGHDDVWMLPRGGCPGPEVVDVGDAVRLVVLDTQWWLHEGPRPATGQCTPGTETAVVDSVRGAIRAAGSRYVVVVGHHPAVTGGQHGGYFDWPSYLFPFHPWARQAGYFANQDVSGEGYRRLIVSLDRAFIGNPPLVYAAGHEHNLQIFRRGVARYQLVSGGGIYGHTTPVRAITGTQYARRASGFMRLSFLKDGRVRISVQVVDAKGNATEDYSAWLDTGRPAVPGTAAADGRDTMQTTPAPLPPAEAPARDTTRTRAGGRP